MVAVVIRTEGPIFIELLLTRIARAHGFGRIGVTIRETILATIDPIFPTSGQGGMTMLWPEGVVKESTPFRFGATAVRPSGTFRMSSRLVLRASYRSKE